MSEPFQLGPPEDWDDDSSEDSLGDLSTNDAIELTEEIKDGMRTMRNRESFSV